MARTQTNTQKVAQRLYNIEKHRRIVNADDDKAIEESLSNRAVELLRHDLSLFEEKTGKKLGGKSGIVAPKNLTTRERVVYESILETFLQDPTSSITGIREEFKKIPTSMKRSGKKYDLFEMAKAVDAAARIKKEVAIKDMIGSDEYKRMWSIAKDYKIKTADMIDALYSVTIEGSQDIGISVLLGEGDFIEYEDEEINDWRYTGQLEEMVLNQLFNVQEVRR